MCDSPTCKLENCNIPYGYCHCGCGQKTNISTHTWATKNTVSGKPNLYIKGHGTRITPEDKKCLFCGAVMYRDRNKSIADFREKKFCSQKCYHQWNTGQNHHNYKNGMRIRSDGYIRTSKDKYIHRQEMEEFLGRELLPTEIVHHIDGNPSNNNIENLHLCATSSEHAKLESINRKRGKDGKFI